MRQLIRWRLLLAMALTLGTATLATAACSGDDCRNLDPERQGCNVNVSNGKTKNIWGVMTIEVRKTSACGGVKWPRVSRSTAYTGGTFKVWLRSGSGTDLAGTAYTAPIPSMTQIYGNMYTGAVQACASISTYRNGEPQCTDLDN